MARTISVCDRESDVYEYLDYKLRHAQRFVIRAKVDRRVLHGEQNLFTTLARDAARLGCYTVNVAQRGGRKARQATLSLRSLRLELQAPAGDAGRCGPLTVNAILAEEVDAPPDVEPLRWVLLTTEPVASAEEARQVVRSLAPDCALRIITRRGRVASALRGNASKVRRTWNGC